MRTKFFVYDPQGRDTSWITQEIIEEYAGSHIKSEAMAEITLTKICGNDKARYLQFMQIIAANPQIHELKAELKDEYGLTYFVGEAMTKEERIYFLENQMRGEKNSLSIVSLSKEIRELRGEVMKPSEQMAKIDITNVTGAIKFDKNNPAEGERLYMAIAGAALVR